jgi:hypothetical protein
MAWFFEQKLNFSLFYQNLIGKRFSKNYKRKWFKRVQTIIKCSRRLIFDHLLAVNLCRLQAKTYTVISFWAKLVRAVKFRPKKIRAKFCRFGRIFPKSANFLLDIGRNSPKSNKIRPQNLGRNLTARIRPFTGEQELLCRIFKGPL